MRDITLKPDTLRSATATGRIQLTEDGAAMINESRVAKGDVRECARIAGIMAVKRTPDWLPHCHPIPVLDASLDFEIEEASMVIRASVRTIAATGVEMEALTAVSAAALCVYDMMKPHVATEALVIEDIRLLEKKGGKSQFGRGIKAGRAVVIVLSDTVAAGRKPDENSAAHSAWIPAAAAIFFQPVISVAMNCSNSTAFIGAASAPAFRKNAFISAESRILLISVFRRSTTAVGVPAGASTPHQSSLALPL